MNYLRSINEIQDITNSNIQKDRTRGIIYAVLFVLVAFDRTFVGAALFLCLMQIVGG